MKLPQLPTHRGRRPRVLSLVYNDASTDSRVLKTTGTLRAAGADTAIVASARPLAGHPAGVGMVGGLEVHRVPDLDLSRMFPRVARTWRRLRGKPLDGTWPAHAPPPPAVDGGPGYEAGRSADAAAPEPQSLKVLAADVWMRIYQATRVAYWWVGAAREGRTLRPDVVHANDANSLVPAMLVTAGTPGRLIYDSHELWRRRNVRPDRWLAPYVEALIESVGIRVAAGVITVSPSIAEWLRQTYRLRHVPTLVRNIPTARELPDPAMGRLRELSGLGPDDRIVSYAGGITTGRGLEESVDALALLPQDVHLVLLGYGDPRYVSRLLRRAAETGVGERLHLVGTVPSAEVPETLADADLAVVFVRPIVLSYRFSLPNKLFESIHAGLPIVAADLPDTAAIVREHGVGQVFDANTPEQLAAAIVLVLADPTAYREAARAAAAELTWEHEAAGLVELYTQVLEGHRD